MAWFFVLFLLLGSRLLAQDIYYPFSVDQDRLSGAPDFGFLNSPLQSQDRLFVRSGHFFRVGADRKPDTSDDIRVRLFGVNLCFGANFPEPADAERLALRLRKLGLNLVRLHHMDSQPDSNPESAGSLLTTGPYPTLNPVAVSRLRGLLDAFSRHGIYVNLNLHVGYTFRPEVDRIPALPASIAFPKQSKPLHLFHPRMVALQEEYTQRVLEALRLKQDPVLAMVEINNESSLIYSWQTKQLGQYYLGDYQQTLAEQWNTFLRSIYSGTALLRDTWGPSLPAGPEMLPGKWQLEIHSPAKAAMELQSLDGEEVVKVSVSQGGAAVILKQVGFSLAAGRSYLAEVEMRADIGSTAAGSVYWDIKQDVSPWQTSIGKTVQVASGWNKFEQLWTPTLSMTNVGRFGISVEKVEGPIWIRRWSLREAPTRGLAVEENLEEANITLVKETENSTSRRVEDFQRFLVNADSRYLERIRSCIREATDPLVPVTGTQVGFGGLANLESHQKMDYLDNHFYVDHYNFPNTSWDGRDWRIRDSSVVEAGLSVFLSIAATRRMGQPFTVSEFNQPWPNKRGAEMDPALSAFASFQDWDAILHFAYAHGRTWDIGVPNGFNINGDWGKYVNLGQSAWLFRSGAIGGGAEPILLPISYNQQQQATRERRNGAISSFLTAIQGFEPAVAFIHPIGIYPSDTIPFPSQARVKPGAPYTADNGQLGYDPERKILLLHSPLVAGIFGYLDQKTATAGILGVESLLHRNNASFLLTPLDGKELTLSSRMLLSMPGYTLRTQPQSNPARPQSLVLYPSSNDWWTLEKDPDYPQKPSGNLNGGASPVWMERMESRIILHHAAESIEVFPLDGSGQRQAPIPVKDIQHEGNDFRIHLQKDGQTLSPWYEILLREFPSRRRT